MFQARNSGLEVTRSIIRNGPPSIRAAQSTGSLRLLELFFLA